MVSDLAHPQLIQRHVALVNTTTGARRHRSATQVAGGVPDAPDLTPARQPTLRADPAHRRAHDSGAAESDRLRLVPDQALDCWADVASVAAVEPARHSSSRSRTRRVVRGRPDVWMMVSQHSTQRIAAQHSTSCAVMMGDRLDIHPSDRISRARESPDFAKLAVVGPQFLHLCERDSLELCLRDVHLALEAHPIGGVSQS